MDAIHASNADHMQVHGDTRPACDGAVQYLGMIPGGGYSEIFGHNCCTIVWYAKSDLVDSGVNTKDAKEVWNEKVVPYILAIAT